MAHFITPMDKQTDRPNGEGTDCHKARTSECRQPYMQGLTRTSNLKQTIYSEPKRDLVSLNKPKQSLASLETAITSREQHLAVTDPDPLLTILCCSDPVTHNGVGSVMA